MIIKSADDKETSLKTLSAILGLPGLSPTTRAMVDQEIRATQTGVEHFVKCETADFDAVVTQLKAAGAPIIAQRQREQCVQSSSRSGLTLESARRSRCRRPGTAAGRTGCDRPTARIKTIHSEANGLRGSVLVDRRRCAQARVAGRATASAQPPITSSYIVELPSKPIAFDKSPEQRARQGVTRAARASSS